VERADGEEAEWGAQQAWPRPRQPHPVLQLWAMCAQGMSSWATYCVFSLQFHSMVDVGFSYTQTPAR
jgi:hypothetical protein